MVETQQLRVIYWNKAKEEWVDMGTFPIPNDRGTSICISPSEEMDEIKIELAEIGRVENGRHFVRIKDG